MTNLTEMKRAGGWVQEGDREVQAQEGTKAAVLLETTPSHGGTRSSSLGAGGDPRLDAGRSAPTSTKANFSSLV